MSTRLGPLAPMPPRLRGSSCGPSVLPLSLPEQTRRSTLFHFKQSVQCRLLAHHVTCRDAAILPELDDKRTLRGLR